MLLVCTVPLTVDVHITVSTRLRPQTRSVPKEMSLCAHCVLTVQLFWTQQHVATGNGLYLPAKSYWLRYEKVLKTRILQ